MYNNLKTLINKLNDTIRVAAERAANICVASGHYEVDLEHLFLALLEQPQCDFALISQHCGIPISVLENDLRSEIARFKTGNTRTPVFSPHLPTLFEHAWLIASLEHASAPIRSSHLLLALLSKPDLAQLAYRASSQFKKFDQNVIKHDAERWCIDSQENSFSQQNAIESDGTAERNCHDASSQAGLSKTVALDKFSTHLTQRARDGKIDPVIGRDNEIRQVMDILMRRRQNNPILTGEPGVGKTAVAEGLALRIIEKDVPEVLQGVELYSLDMGLLQAGASVKGEFENRLKSIIDEVRKNPTPIILFIDEAHTMIGAGGQAGQNDAANLLKPALARGELRTIAATTWSEYKKYFEKDAALARRFQVVKVEEPSEELACAMLRGMASLMEKHFHVRIFDDAITEAVRLSHRYISGRQLPDKAISILDTACARVALGQSATPALIDDLIKKEARLKAELHSLEREECVGNQHGARLSELQSLLTDLALELAQYRLRWEQEQALNVKIQSARTDLEQRAATDISTGKRSSTDSKLAKTLRKYLEELRTLQGESPLVPVQVDGAVVAAIVAAWTGIPLGKMVRDDIKTVMNLNALIGERVLGQPHAIEAISQRIRTARANLDDPNKPQGVFLFAGPSGVGKTETALALADALYGGERKLITINMSEYQEAHSVSGLKGSPPGYVGYGEGGVLTEAVRRQPYSVVLLDEVEKAHPDVLELFFQVFDKGVLDDAEGREIDFRNTLIILTSNVASGLIMQNCLNKTDKDLPAIDVLEAAIRPHLMKVFKPAFLGRMKVVPYYPISDAVLTDIIHLKLARIKKRIVENHGTEFSYDKTLVDAVLSRCIEVDSGARNVDHILNGSLLPEMAGSILSGMAEERSVAKIKVTANKIGQFKYAIK
ncbi:type VI secretion system ATPase TssH [Herbaspirillum sp. RTI4]|uniref:type VI secretion system ATPase TssH n=1 Tax=Herbaspirillum sp. RTI4 TaxID=3048640 RepID=UPI002AB57DDC|nr:type VI secretion system ATPase TssH [Herbaspirillum sp. RTI4]MDY7579023.1 type VI secretion system ATPase TssH [Herbaspirillum sp. RTI4]MEA9980954.1 type VI secretion system ATPase TssH [Herbaspirillum sp. RTI4]